MIKLASLSNVSVILFTTCITSLLFTPSTQAIYLPLNGSQQLQQEATSAAGGDPPLTSALFGPQNNNIAPTIDYSHNMRILKLPKSTQIGSLVYRLKGSDGDPNTELSFGISGGFGIGRSLLDVVPVQHSWNEADVYLRGQLEQPLYNLTVYVTDGNKTTQVESTLIVTNDEPEEADALDQSELYGNHSGKAPPNGNNNLLLSPFVNPKHVFNVPENAKLNEPIGYVSVLESSKSDLPVRFELRGKGSEKFNIKYVFGPKGQSKGEIVLAGELDYERQNLFALKVLALNAWTNSRLDTRNVATLDIVITVGDLQDTAPVFRSLPQAILVANTLEAEALVAKIEAEDGDFADQRPVQFALDANSPLANYFTIEKATGEIRLRRPASELALHAAWDSAEWSLLRVFASELADASSYEHLWPPMYAKAELPLRMVDLENRPPEFIGGWQTGEQGLLSGGSPTSPKVLHGFLAESDKLEQAGRLVSWYTNATETGRPLVDELSSSMGGRPLVLDLGLGSNGTFQLSLEGPDAHLFQLEPQFPVAKQTSFTLSVSPLANNSLMDYEQAGGQPSRRTFSLEILARDFGQPTRRSSRIKCSIELLDVDDNPPAFESDLYTFSVYENAPAGTPLGTLRARDPDSGSKVAYRLARAPEASEERELFRLDPDSGLLSLRGPLDRERRASYLLLAEARDTSTGNGRAANYTQVLVNVLDVNDNAPLFPQSHYDAVLQADGTFHQPLVVRALDADEPNTANSQVAYEIIAGNSNEQFSIDTVSGVIYPSLFPAGTDFLSGSNTKESLANALPQIPPILKEPIMPFSQQQNQAGKILPAHEVEEAARRAHSPRLSNNREPSGRLLGNNSGQRLPIEVEISNSGLGQPEQQRSRSTQVPLWFRRQQQAASGPPQMDTEQLPALDLLLNLESDSAASSEPAEPTELEREQQQRRRSLPAAFQPAPSSQLPRLPPLTSLVVRAHDFGIPLRSSTVRVNVFNQALLWRSLSVILNGTAEQLEARREAIERAFSSITGSRASIESIEALSESSSISVARVKLTVPQHSLVDLTDLSALINAIDFHPADQGSPRHHTPATHYINEAGKLFPVPTTQPGGPSANISHVSPAANGLYTDVHSFQLEDGQQLERRLLIYIIIVVVCIAILLLIWIVYYCTRESNYYRERQQLKQLVSSAASNRKRDSKQPVETYKRREDSAGEPPEATKPKSTELAAGGAIGKNLGKLAAGERQLCSQERASTTNTSELLLAPEAALGNPKHRLAPTTTTNLLKPDHLSMYNGQVWFEPAGGSNSRGTSVAAGRRAQMASRRASSAPSGGSLDSETTLNQGGLSARVWRGAYPLGSALPRDASGQFFPNTVGYMENLEALSLLGARNRLLSGNSSRLLGFKGRQHKVGPLELQDSFSHSKGAHLNPAFEHEQELKPKRQARRPTLTRSERTSSRSASSASGSSLGTDSNAVVLDSDQELLGFDSTGTPIIATHTQPDSKRPFKTLVVDMLEPLGENATTPDKTHPAAATQTPAKNSVLAGSKREEQLKHAQAADESSEVKPEKSAPQEALERAPKGDAEASPARPTSGSSSKSERFRNRDSPDSHGNLMSELNDKLLARRKQSDGALEPAGEAKQQAATTRPERRELSLAGSCGGESNGSQQSAAMNSRKQLADMNNVELLEKQSIFTITYSGLATDKLPA